MRKEAGGILVIAIVVTLVLTILAMTVIQSVNTQTKVAGQNRSSETALYIAEAGVVWGIDRLGEEPFNLGDTAASLDPALDTDNAPLIVTSDTTWPDAASPNYAWHELTTGEQAYGGGTFRVAVSDDIDGDGATGAGGTTVSDFSKDSNQTILLRSLGEDADGSRRLVEVVLTNE